MKSLVVSLMFVVVSMTMGVEHSDPLDDPVKRIGTYDSRSIAVAYAGSSLFRQKLDPLRAKMKEAQEQGDKERIAELDQQGRAMQHQMHLQGFGTAPVDNILDLIADKLPRLKKTTGVQLLISVWDIEQLEQYPGVEQVDVTEAMVDLLEPTERQRKRALEIRNHDPVPMEKLEKMKH